MPPPVTLGCWEGLWKISMVLGPAPWVHLAGGTGSWHQNVVPGTTLVLCEGDSDISKQIFKLHHYFMCWDVEPRN